MSDAPRVIRYAEPALNTSTGKDQKRKSTDHMLVTVMTTQRVTAETRHVRRVEHPTDGVVDDLGLGKRLVTALVRDDPKAGGKKAGKECVERPKHEARGRVEVRVGESDVLGPEERVEEIGSLVNGGDDCRVHHTEDDGS